VTRLWVKGERDPRNADWAQQRGKADNVGALLPWNDWEKRRERMQNNCRCANALDPESPSYEPAFFLAGGAEEVAAAAEDESTVCSSPPAEEEKDDAEK
jgi:hypothetical protein